MRGKKKLTTEPGHAKRSKQPLKKLLKFWWVLPILFLAGSALTAFMILRGNHVTACTGAQTENFKCWQQRYQQIVAKQSVKEAFVIIKKDDAAVPYVHANCHQLAHVIGRAAGNKYGDVSKAYDQGDNYCWSGYYHGVMEAIAVKIGASHIVAQINTICASAKQKQEYSFYHYNCVHGLGHGLMAVQNNQLFTALKSCDSLEGQWQQESCYGGVFMENVMSEINPDHHTDYLKTDDPLYPCDAVEDQYKQQCYLMQTSHALKLVNYDFSKGFALCDTVGNFADTCYQSLGRDSSGSSLSDPVATTEHCMLGTTYESRDNCFIGAVKDFISYYHSDVQGKALCNALTDANLKASCLTTAVEYYKTF